jgi:hypothetical protein
VGHPHKEEKGRPVGLPDAPPWYDRHNITNKNLQPGCPIFRRRLAKGGRSRNPRGTATRAREKRSLSLGQPAGSCLLGLTEADLNAFFLPFMSRPPPFKS